MIERINAGRYAPPSASRRSSGNGALGRQPRDDGPGPWATGHRAGEPNSLRARLIALDVASVLVPWAVALAVWPGVRVDGAVLAWGAGATLAAIAGQRLYLARVCSVRAVEIERIGRAAIVGGAAAAAAAVATGATPRPTAAIATAALVAFLALVTARGVFRAWLADRRRAGRYQRDVVLIGANEEATELCRVARNHPEMGYRVIGFVGPPAAGDALPVPWLGDYEDAVEATREVGATGALLVATAMGPGHLNAVARELLDAKLHVQLSSGLRGIASQRLRALPLAHEPLLYVEPVVLLRPRLAVKRVLDIALASLVLFATLPVLVAAAIAIKLEDGAPIFFHQRRIGRNERPFTLYKLRTMVPDAEQQRPGLAAVNERRDGPLFKMTPDPRVTRVGLLLRASGVDELPQLLNVILGTMSLIGPRPALAEEVAQFDAELRERATVRPGITGLWQVEAGDAPEFEAYRRLDLFYIRNWSVGLDLGILVATIWVVAGRTLRAIPATLRRRPVEESIVLD